MAAIKSGPPPAWPSTVRTARMSAGERQGVDRDRDEEPPWRRRQDDVRHGHTGAEGWDREEVNMAHPVRHRAIGGHVSLAPAGTAPLVAIRDGEDPARTRGGLQDPVDRGAVRPPP